MKRVLAAVLCVVMAVLMAVPAFAEEKDYKIEDAGWRTNGGSVEAYWDKPKSDTRYKITIYRQVGDGSRKALYKETVSGTHVYVSPLIAYHGTGNYYFDVFPVKGGEQYRVSSDCLDVDSEYHRIIKAQVGTAVDQAVTQAAAAPQGPTYVWSQGPGGVWQLRKNGELVTNQWAQVNGHWYLLDAQGNMLKGWQQRDGKSYYLNEVSGANGYPEGACMINTVTPDGHRVDGSGACVS